MSSVSNLEDFEALEPFFNIIKQGAGGLVDGGHYFGMLTDDVVFEYVITVPGYPRRVAGRDAVAELYRPYGDTFGLHRCHDLRVHHDQKTGAVVLEYASEGHVVPTRAPTPATTSRCSRPSTGRSPTGATTSTRSQSSTRAGRPTSKHQTPRRKEPGPAVDQPDRPRKLATALRRHQRGGVPRHLPHSGGAAQDGRALLGGQVITGFQQAGQQLRVGGEGTE